MPPTDEATQVTQIPGVLHTLDERTTWYNRVANAAETTEVFRQPVTFEDEINADSRWREALHSRNCRASIHRDRTDPNQLVLVISNIRRKR